MGDSAETGREVLTRLVNEVGQDTACQRLGIKPALLARLLNGGTIVPDHLRVAALKILGKNESS
jgi:hypothetical protein